MSTKEKLLGKATIRFRGTAKGRPHVQRTALFDEQSEQSTISESVALLAGIKTLDEFKDDEECKCGLLKAEALVGKTWVTLRDEPETDTVLVWWFPGNEDSGVSFSKFVLKHTRRTTIVEVVEGDGNSGGE